MKVLRARVVPMKVALLKAPRVLVRMRVHHVKAAPVRMRVHRHVKVARVKAHHVKAVPVRMRAHHHVRVVPVRVHRANVKPLKVHQVRAVRMRVHHANVNPMKVLQVRAVPLRVHQAKAAHMKVHLHHHVKAAARLKVQIVVKNVAVVTERTKADHTGTATMKLLCLLSKRGHAS